MRLIVKFEPENGILRISVNYNHIIQSFILNNIKEKLAEWVHDEGYQFGKRRFKLYTFSRLFGENRRYDPISKKLIFEGRVWFKISSVDIEILESFAATLVKEGVVRIGSAKCNLVSIEVERPFKLSGPMKIKAISPITVYRTLYTSDGQKKTYYFTPFEKEFEELVFDNLRRKAKAYFSKNDIPPLEGYIKPVRVKKHNEIITKFKGVIVKGWVGIYELSLPEPWFMLAYNAGLGAKNSQGFGMIEVVRNKD